MASSTDDRLRFHGLPSPLHTCEEMNTRVNARVLPRHVQIPFLDDQLPPPPGYRSDLKSEYQSLMSHPADFFSPRRGPSAYSTMAPWPGSACLHPVIGGITHVDSLFDGILKTLTLLEAEERPFVFARKAKSLSTRTGKMPAQGLQVGKAPGTQKHHYQGDVWSGAWLDLDQCCSPRARMWVFLPRISWGPRTDTRMVQKVEKTHRLAPWTTISA